VLSNHDHARAAYAAQEFDEIIRHENACMHFHHQCLNVIVTYMPAFLPLINIHKLYVDQFRYMRVTYQMDDASPAPVVISSEAFLTLKRLNNELEEVIETIEILNSPQLMKQIERSKKDVKAGRVCELSGADDLDSIWK
jgi:hypothetical protein